MLRFKLVGLIRRFFIIKPVTSIRERWIYNMAMINDYYLGLIANDANNRIKNARVTVDNTVYNYDFYRTTIENNSIKKFVYLQDDLQGLVQKAVLVDAGGN